MTFNLNTWQKTSNKFSTFFTILFVIIMVTLTFSADAKPKIKIKYGYSLDGFVRVQVKNETNKDLACWVAIDGFKKKFRLPPKMTSQWVTANDKRYTYTNFSTWCDYIDLHPEYQKYNRG
mgnify:CR=1 FL=1